VPTEEPTPAPHQSAFLTPQPDGKGAADFEKDHLREEKKTSIRVGEEGGADLLRAKKPGLLGNLYEPFLYLGEKTSTRRGDGKDPIPFPSPKPGKKACCQFR